MAFVHHTTLAPTKLELLSSWLPSRPWYRGAADGPRLTKAGGFRLDDPDGEVGIEFLVVADTAGGEPVTYLAPLTYRGAPLEDAEHALLGTAEHGVLGRRWVYDACHDPVATAQLLALIEGRAQAQQQSVSDAPDHEVTRSHPGEGTLAEATVTDVAEGDEATTLALGRDATLRLHRVLRPSSDDPATPPQSADGHVGGPWQAPDGTRVRGQFAVLHTGSRP